MHTLKLENVEEAVGLFGTRDEHLKMIERRTGVHVKHRGGKITITGADEMATRVGELLENFLGQLRCGRSISPEDVSYGLLMIEGNKGEKYREDREDIIIDARGKPVRARTPNQRKYVAAMEKHDLVFGIGPAGTGKTYLAVAMALKRLNERRVERIVVARPAVEAGERLGFLPGDYQQKVDPYLRPIFDALFNMMQYEKCGKLLERGIIEVAPLAYMRGRTLDAAFAILDEAQNTTVDQIKMFLTRLGKSSCAVVTGDITQIDLPPGTISGLVDAERRLHNFTQFAFIHFGKEDVMRHGLVGQIIEAYQSDV